MTFTRYRVSYIRADGRNTPGVDVPYGVRLRGHFHGGARRTPSTAGFDLVRNIGEVRGAARRLAANQDLITVIAQVTFYGKDHAGHDVSASGNIGITFGNFGDPD